MHFHSTASGRHLDAHPHACPCDELTAEAESESACASASDDDNDRVFFRFLFFLCFFLCSDPGKRLLVLFLPPHLHLHHHPERLR